MTVVTTWGCPSSCSGGPDSIGKGRTLKPSFRAHWPSRAAGLHSALPFFDLLISTFQRDRKTSFSSGCSPPPFMRSSIAGSAAIESPLPTLKLTAEGVDRPPVSGDCRAHQKKAGRPLGYRSPGRGSMSGLICPPLNGGTVRVRPCRRFGIGSRRMRNVPNVRRRCWEEGSSFPSPPAVQSGVAASPPGKVPSAAARLAER